MFLNILQAARTEPLRVAVVGSGPAGFYVAAPLLAAGAHVDLIERRDPGASSAGVARPS